jgi:hypothetical protein
VPAIMANVPLALPMPGHYRGHACFLHSTNQ